MAIIKFRCKVCGYIHEGAAAPEKCPICGVPASEFTLIKKKGMFSDTNSNAYIIMYSTVMVILVALVLSVTSLSLQERQYANELNETKQSILLSLSAGGENYDSFVTAYVVDAQGNKIEGEDVFTLLKDLSGSFAAGKYPVFEAADGRVVLPVTGSGLWGPIWGYVALEKDMNTIAGITMAHKGETPGLGSEIATTKHWAMYPGKTLFEGDKFVSVSLRKGGAQDPAHEVDAISGGTKTSDGVTAMLHTGLGYYLPMFEARRRAEMDALAQVEADAAATAAQLATADSLAAVAVAPVVRRKRAVEGEEVAPASKKPVASEEPAAVEVSNEENVENNE